MHSFSGCELDCMFSSKLQTFPGHAMPSDVQVAICFPELYFVCAWTSMLVPAQGVSSNKLTLAQHDNPPGIAKDLPAACSVLLMFCLVFYAACLPVNTFMFSYAVPFCLPLDFFSSLTIISVVSHYPHQCLPLPQPQLFSDHSPTTLPISAVNPSISVWFMIYRILQFFS